VYNTFCVNFLKKLIFSFLIICIGILLGFIASHFLIQKNILQKNTNSQKQVIGFLPFSLLSRAGTDYSRYITQLSYFSLTVNPDGTIRKLNSQTEEEPGWYALSSGRVAPFLDSAKAKNISLSLVAYSGDSNDIAGLIANPKVNAKTLSNEIIPIMKQNNFSNLNLDIEYTSNASSSSSQNFTKFVQEIKSNLKAQKAGTLTVDIAPSDFVKSNLVDPKAIGKIADSIVIMAYDYHSTASYVSGPVAPLYGAGIESEYDVNTAIQKAVSDIPSSKVILGAPLYGYEWETLNSAPRSAVIPGTGVAASNKRAEQTLNNCTNCSLHFDQTNQEAYFTYFDSNSNTFHQIFYPTFNSTQAKANIANQYNLGGVALWALGYEGSTILNPLSSYLKQN